MIPHVLRKGEAILCFSVDRVELPRNVYISCFKDKILTLEFHGTCFIRSQGFINAEYVFLGLLTGNQLYIKANH